MRRRSPASDLSGLERGGNAVPADHACGRAVERAASPPPCERECAWADGCACVRPVCAGAVL